MKAYVWLLGGMVAVFPASGTSQEMLSSQADSIIRRVIVQTVSQSYDSALANCRRLGTLSGGAPFGEFLTAAVLQSRMLDYENTSGEEAFFAASRKARWLFQRELRDHPRSALDHFFIGATYGYEAFYYGKRNRLLDGFRSGWQCMQELNAALALDPKLYDAYLGIGTFRYYQAKLGKAFSWLPFVEDNREQAVAMIRKAIYYGKYSSAAAINGLSWILMEEGRAQEALALVDSALQLYPGSRFFLWGAAEANFRLQRWGEAQRCYELILESFAAENHPSPYNEVACYLRLSDINFRQANYDACRRQLAELFAIPLSKADRERSSKLLKRARELEKEVNRL